MKTLAAFLCVICVAAGAQQSTLFQSETKIVLVDAVVTGKKGEYVRGLTAKDFRVWEDNKEQTIKSFSLETDASAAEPRRLVLFFDNSSMSVADQGAARQAAASFIDASFSDAQTEPKRLMAVVTFDGEFHVAQSFTANAGRLKEAVRGVRLTSNTPAAGRRPPDAVRGLIPSVVNLARNLDAAPGRKIIVLLTGDTSFANAQPAEVAGLVQRCNRSNVAVYPVVQTLAQDPSGNRFPLGVSRPGVTAPANTVPDMRPDDSIPFAIASGTGGFVVSGSNDILAQLQRIGAEQNQYYALGYTPPASKDGMCHTLRVKVDRGGAGVRARSSYCTAKPQDLLAESRVEQDLEKRAAAAQTGAPAAVQAPFFYLAPNVARIHVTMNIATDGLKLENQKGKLHTEINILGIASTLDGAVVARFSDIVKRDFENKPEKPLHYEKDFKIIPGQYTLTVVFSSGGANSGKVETPLAVDAYDRSRLAISGLALSKEVRPTSELGLEASLIDEGTPLIAGGMQVIPSGSNVFTKSEQAFCYFEIYPPRAVETATPNLGVDLRILDRKTGGQRWNGGPMKLDPPAAGQSAIPAGLHVPFTSLPAGSYQLEVTATRGDEAVKRTINFEIE